MEDLNPELYAYFPTLKDLTFGKLRDYDANVNKAGKVPTYKALNIKCDMDPKDGVATYSAFVLSILYNRMRMGNQ